MQSPFAPGDFARDVAPLVALYLATAATIQRLQHARPGRARNAARFINLLLASLLAGNGAGAERFVHPPLRGLAPGRHLEAEQAITRSYLPMLAIMPASILSGLQVLVLMPRRRGTSYWLTVAGTLGMLGTFATTLMELPLNRQTLTSSPEAPEEWAQSRPRWERFNHVRTLLEVFGWACLSLGALADERR